MSASVVTLQISSDGDRGVDEIVEAFWEALREAGIDHNITVTSVERVEDDE